MSLQVNLKALERVIERLNIVDPVNILLDPKQKMPLGVIFSREKYHQVRINADLDPINANWIALHELMHASQFERLGGDFDEIYRSQLVEQGFDPRETLDWAIGQGREHSYEELVRYNQVPLEIEANDFARSCDDLYQVIS